MCCASKLDDVCRVVWSEKCRKAPKRYRLLFQSLELRCAIKQATDGRTDGRTEAEDRGLGCRGLATAAAAAADDGGNDDD